MTRHAPRRLFRRLRDTAGSNMLEAAIITPLLLLLTLAVVDFASLFYVYLALENGVSQATRYAVTGNLMDDPLHPGTPLSRRGLHQARDAQRHAEPHDSPTAPSRSAISRPAPAPGSAGQAGRPTSRKSRSTTRGRS